MKLKNFVKKFVADNTTVYLYGNEHQIIDCNGEKCTEINFLETVMNWQISVDKGAKTYFKAHPDVKKSKYCNNKVIKIIGNANNHRCADEVSIVIEVKDNE